MNPNRFAPLNYENRDHSSHFLLQAALAMLPLDAPSAPPLGINNGSNSNNVAGPWDFEATPSVGLALRAEALVLSSCRLWCPPRPWSLLRGSHVSGGRGAATAAGGGVGDGERSGGTFLHRVSAHALACPANHGSGARLLAALLPAESPTPLHRVTLPVSTAAAAAAGVAAAADAAGGSDDGSGGGGGGGAGLGRLVGRVHTAAALERSEGLRRQAVAVLESRVGDVLKCWDLCVAGDLFYVPGGAGADDDGRGGGEEAEEGNGDDEEWDGGGGWRPALAVNPVLAVTASEVVNVPAVVLTLCHSASPVLQRRVLELARK